MKVKVIMDQSKLRKLSANQLKAGRMVAEQMLTELIQEQRMPFDEGTLQNIQTSIETRNEEISIVHDTPYAQKLYYNPQYNFSQTINRNAGGEWWSDWLEGDRASRPAELFSKFYRDLMGG